MSQYQLIAEAILKMFRITTKIFLRTPLPSHGVGMNLPNRVGRATPNANRRVSQLDAIGKGFFLCDPACQ